MTRPILFLSDLGLKDDFVGVCHSVIATIAPDARVVDCRTASCRWTSRSGRCSWPTASPTFPRTPCSWGVVDPGVGTDRKAIAVRSAAGAMLVGPDNGLLSLAWEALGGVDAAFEITSPDAPLAGLPRLPRP